MASSQNSCLRYLFALMFASLALMQCGKALAQSTTEDEIVVISKNGRLRWHVGRASTIHQRRWWDSHGFHTTLRWWICLSHEVHS